MKITKSKLNQIIEEELEKTLKMELLGQVGTALKGAVGKFGGAFKGKTQPQTQTATQSQQNTQTSIPNIENIKKSLNSMEDVVIILKDYIDEEKIKQSEGQSGSFFFDSFQRQYQTVKQQLGIK